MFAEHRLNSLFALFANKVKTCREACGVHERPAEATHSQTSSRHDNTQGRRGALIGPRQALVLFVLPNPLILDLRDETEFPLAMKTLVA